MIWELRQEHKISPLIEVSGLPRSTYYYCTKRKTEPDKYRELKEQITTIYPENKVRYGCRRITGELHSRGYVISHKTVQRLMKDGRSLLCENEETQVLQGRDCQDRAKPVGTGF